ncbi:MAG: CDGSH iron-sulfur domain-containing protein [Alphaproteobacteria bacterium]|nr:CDGSH iron-sulfur domain-containing protein [Alphaproteobacteria bacterium]MBT4084390.1 CDGSH iron-sulfur domain-containing protein [Alphaproteobacteria bacterium]MBT4545612.1 CDGSH iron-sulfur domain-containing protein [Alphaproteobacteria bacterium]MBT7748069.1 CDGSH iron-sulfur domain-containing protein [Alphaproteobacteria bacterium]
MVFSIKFFNHDPISNPLKIGNINMTTSVIAQKSPFAVDLEAGKDYYYCSCGLSQNQPFCDGAHKPTSFTPVKFTAEETKTAYLCGCKSNDGTPFCNGAHKEL